MQEWVVPRSIPNVMSPRASPGRPAVTQPLICEARPGQPGRPGSGRAASSPSTAGSAPGAVPARSRASTAGLTRSARAGYGSVPFRKRWNAAMNRAVSLSRHAPARRDDPAGPGGQEGRRERERLVVVGLGHVGQAGREHDEAPPDTGPALLLAPRRTSADATVFPAPRSRWEPRTGTCARPWQPKCSTDAPG